MKNRLLLATLLAATVVFSARCSENPAGPDAGSSADAAVDPPDAAEPQDVGRPDTGPRPCDPSKCAEGNICVQNKCMLACARHTECPDESYDCRSVEGSLVCVPNGMPLGEGQFGYPCGATGTCADGFRCMGGAGDPSSYCAREGCGTDQDCPGNYSCVFRDVAVNPDAGVDAAFSTITVCQRRGFCAPADSLVDCNNENASFGKDSAGRGWCLKGCTAAERYGCGAGNECVETAAGGQCWPRAMTCEPSEKFCSRCASSVDCGPGGYCYADPYTKEPMCVTPCSADSDCNAGALPTGRLLGECGVLWEGMCMPQETGFSGDPNALSCWFELCPDGTRTGQLPFAGCAEADFVDATGATADRKISGTVAELDGGVLQGSYTPKCLKIKMGQSVTFQPVSATLSDGQTYDFPLTQACGPIYTIGSLEKGVAATIRLNKGGLYGYYEPYVGGKEGKDMAGAILVVP
ncbi:MAG TPA: hypothetical protein VGK67_17140 [Myxococcales bacterium]